MHFDSIVGRVMIMTVAGIPVLAHGTEIDNVADADSIMHLDEVTVTAIKHSADLSLMPFATTTLPYEQIERLGVASLHGVSEIAPNFYIPQYGSRMTSSIYVRGLGARIDQPAVGLSIDNVPLLNKDAYDFNLADIDRIEVLRGPQSTLYGRNTMAGQINIYTLSPMKYQGSRISARVSNGPEAAMTISHYAKFSPDLGMSFSGYFNFSNGFYHNIYNDYKVGTEKSMQLRWRTEWEPSSSLSVSNVAAFNLNRNGGYPYEYMLEGQRSNTGVVNYNDTCYYRRNAFTDGVTVLWRQPKFTLSSITSVQYVDDRVTLDQDFTPLDFFTLSQGRHEWALTQDLVMRGNAGVYHWLAGAFAFYKHTSMNAPVTFKSTGINTLITDRVNGIISKAAENNPMMSSMNMGIEWLDQSFVLNSVFSMPTHGLALYHESTFDVGTFNVSIGGRLDYEMVRLRYDNNYDTGFALSSRMGRFDFPLSYDNVGKMHQHFLEFMPKFTVSYELPMKEKSDVYATVSRGYKSGGYNTQMFSEFLKQEMTQSMLDVLNDDLPGKFPPQMPPQVVGMISDMIPKSIGNNYSVERFIAYKPEVSWNYEIGAHVSCAENRVHTDIALFYIDCRNQQLTMFPDGDITGRVTTNAGKTRSFGAELQVRYTPADRWNCVLSYGYTNAKFVKFSDGLNDYSHKYVPYAPRHTLFSSLTYTQPLGNKWSLSFSANVRGAGSIEWNEENSLRQPFYALLGLNITASRGWLELQAWTENLTGTRYHTFYFESIRNQFVQRGRPRTVGGTLRLYFDAAD